ncbi:MAG: ribose-phosphate diphosphokinase [Simkaniaceae bacterium]|nr:ribose-phosphate diphosphokinase [Simkaniaceae bacterium]
MTSKSPFLLLSGTSHRGLAEGVAKELDVQLGEVEIETFPDGEIGVQILENVRGREIFVMQSIAGDPNLYLMELLIMIDALKRASAAKVAVILPYFGYSRQDRRGVRREPITAKLVADLLERAGASQVLTLDLHAEQLQGFFDIPVDNLYARRALISSVKSRENLCVVAPDLGSIKLAQRYADELGSEFAIIDKSRIDAKEVKFDALIGSVEGKNVIIVDDMISTGKTLELAGRVCLERGAKSVRGLVTHLLSVPKSLSSIETLHVSDSIFHDPASLPSNVEVVSVAPLIADAIGRVVSGESISLLFEN